MSRALLFLLASAILVVVTAWWSLDLPIVVGGKEIVGFFSPRALPVLFGALALFGIALMVTLATAIRAWMGRAAPPETPAPPEGNAPATH